MKVNKAENGLLIKNKDREIAIVCQTESAE
jgi:hypothetical protein